MKFSHISFSGLLVTHLFALFFLLPAHGVTTSAAWSFESESIYVSTTGSDDADGDRQNPVRTIGRAIEVAPNGSTVFIRNGTYREGGLYISQKALTIRPYQTEQVVMKGSVVISDWVQDGQVWRHDGWTTEFEPDSYPPEALTDKAPYAKLPDMLFMDGIALSQVGSLAEVDTGKFFMDYENDQIFVGSDPTVKLVEVSKWSQALVVVTSSANGTRISNLKIMHYAGNRFEGALHCDRATATFTDNAILQNASRGIAIYNSSGSMIRNNRIHHNGLMGIGVFRSNSLTIKGNDIFANNRERFAAYGAEAEAAGIKITRSERPFIRDNIVSNNFANGIWIDLTVNQPYIVSNTVSGNLAFGLFCEVSARALIGRNIVNSNGDYGIAISNSSKVDIYHNTVVDNAGQIAVFDDGRVNENTSEYERGITWITRGARIKNNILADSVGAQSILYVNDFSKKLNAADMISDLDFNAYHRDFPLQMAVDWSIEPGKIISYRTRRLFATKTSREQNGLGFRSAKSPFFVNTEAGDFNLLSNSPAISAAEILPDILARRLGLPTNIANDLGAIQFE